MPPAGFEPTISASEQPQTYDLKRTATETGLVSRYMKNNILLEVLLRVNIPDLLSVSSL